MPLLRPTLQQIIDRIRADIRSELGINTILRRTFLGAISRALGGQSHVLHGNLDFVSKNLLPTAEADDETVLIWGQLFGLEPTPAQQAELQIKILGNQGAIIPAGTQWQNDQGAIYTQQAEATIPAPVTGVAEVTQVTTIADVAQSLAGTYFFVNSPSTEYVVFYRVDGNGSDPNLTGKTSVQVDIGEDDTANDVASATQAILDTASDLTVTVSTNVLTITNDDTGAVEDATDFTTGFSIITTIQGVTQVDVEAIANVVSEDGGEAGNVANGEFLTILSSIAGVQSQAEVTSTIVQGEDTETIENFRVRLLQRIQEPPSGGNVNDYEQRALTVPGVTRAWVYPDFEGPSTGSVGVAFVEDNESNIIPDATKIQEVQNSLDARDFRPVTAKVTAFAPTALTVDLVVQIQPNTQAVREAATQELRDLIFRDANPKGAYESPSSVYDGVLLLSKIREAISRATGEQDHVIVTINGSAPANVEPTTTGELIQLGTVTWQPLV